MSRRNLLKAGSASALGLAFASFAAPARRAAAQGEAGFEVIDLSHVFGPDMPVYTLGEEPTRETYLSVEENGYFIQYWTFYEHVGTHCDFPAHFIADGETVDNFGAGQLVSRAVVINIAAKAAENADAMLEVADIEAWEAEHGEIPTGAVVFMNSGWASRWPNEDFRNADAEGGQHYPGFSGEAVTWLLENRGINGIGVDTLSLDPGNSATFDAHYAVCGNGIYGVENTANLDALEGADNAIVIIGIPRWEGSGGGPTRVLALVGA
ncbi:MAG: cyclase family protein [Anaerolineae bacterium]|nr:cyclase family protein [Anaerolineae bacterium]